MKVTLNVTAELGRGHREQLPAIEIADAPDLWLHVRVDDQVLVREMPGLMPRVVHRRIEFGAEPHLTISCEVFKPRDEEKPKAAAEPEKPAGRRGAKR